MSDADRSSEGSACRDQASPPRGDDPDRSELLHDDWFAFGIPAQHPVAARLVVGPDDVRDIGERNERYDAVAPSGDGVGSEVDGSHYTPPPARGFASGNVPDRPYDNPNPSQSAAGKAHARRRGGVCTPGARLRTVFFDRC